MSELQQHFANLFHDAIPRHGTQTTQTVSAATVVFRQPARTTTTSTSEHRVDVATMLIDDLLLVTAAVQNEFVQFLPLVVVLVHLIGRLVLMLDELSS